jgi:hypothetical protein
MDWRDLYRGSKYDALFRGEPLRVQPSAMMRNIGQFLLPQSSGPGKGLQIAPINPLRTRLYIRFNNTFIVEGDATRVWVSEDEYVNPARDFMIGPIEWGEGAEWKRVTQAALYAFADQANVVAQVQEETF